MTTARAQFIEELVSRAPQSVDGALLRHAATLLIGEDRLLYEALVAEAAAQREVEREGLTDQHRVATVAAHAKAVAHREAMDTRFKEQMYERIGRDTVSHDPATVTADPSQEAGPETWADRADPFTVPI